MHNTPSGRFYEIQGAVAVQTPYTPHEANKSGLGSRVNYTLVAPVLASNMVLFEENEYFILVRINSLDSLDDLHLHSRSRRNENFLK